MPQIWMTLEELGKLLNRSEREVRCDEAVLQLDKRKGRDGKYRVQLSDKWVALFIGRIRQPNRSLDIALSRHLLDSGFSGADLTEASRACYPWKH